MKTGFTTSKGSSFDIAHEEIDLETVIDIDGSNFSLRLSLKDAQELSEILASMSKIRHLTDGDDTYICGISRGGIGPEIYRESGAGPICPACRSKLSSWLTE